MSRTTNTYLGGEKNLLKNIELDKVGRLRPMLEIQTQKELVQERFLQFALQKWTHDSVKKDAVL